MTRPAAFLDRDGTINEDVNYLRRPEDVRLLPGAAEALRKLGEAGVLRVIVTNQSGIARGYLTDELFEAIQAELRRRLRAEGADYDAVYYCPHLPEGTVEAYAQTCACRKPKPGMVQRAIWEHDIDVARSFAVGDSERDLLAARAAGCPTLVLVADKPAPGSVADRVVPGLLEGVQWYLAGEDSDE